MTLILMLKCSCGKYYSVYVPKRMLFKERIGTPEAIREGEILDRRDTNREEVKNFAENAQGAKFVDASISDVVQCECGNVLDIVQLVKKRGKTLMEAVKERLKKVRIGNKEWTREEIERRNDQVIQELDAQGYFDEPEEK